MTQTAPSPLVLFSGLAADAAVFSPQQLAFPGLIVPTWPVPHPRDTLETYSDRLADALRGHAPAVIGGASFGGIVALHVAQRLCPQAVVLIGSVRSPAELPRIARWSRFLKPLIPLLPVRLWQLCCAPLTSRRIQHWLPHFSGVVKQFRDSDPAVFKWSLARILDWKTAPAVHCPVYRIHGERDWVLPIGRTPPDAVIPGGGHVISITHPNEVNDFIRSVISQTMDQRNPASTLPADKHKL